MIKKNVTKTILAVFMLICIYGTAIPAASLQLATQKVEDLLGISSFLMNEKEEIFLFSYRMGKIFKFTPAGNFAKEFCRKGLGPGEITRVFYMFHNPLNDCLYLPEYVSGGRAKVTIYDSEGNFKGLFKPGISRKHMDHILKIIFRKDGSYFIITRERVGWKPRGKFYLTQDEIWVRYFSKEGKFISSIFKTITNDELSQALRYGGPRILYTPSVPIKLKPGSNHITVSRSDENLISIYDFQGKNIKTIALEIPKEKLTEKEFAEAKNEVIKFYEKGSDPRMLYLAKHMIKLEYKPIYEGQFLTDEYIVLTKVIERNDAGYPQKTKLMFFNWDGEKKKEKVINGLVSNYQKGRLFIKFYDVEGNEYFKIDSSIMPAEGYDRSNKISQGQ